MIRPSTIATLAAAVLLTAAATLALPSAPAQAAYCSGGAGVSVLVDFGALGGGTATGCGSGSVADQAFTTAGFSLKDSAQQRGFVCQVDDKPAAGKPCTATNAYWGFFVSSHGKPWVYASLGVHQEPVHAGDSVALVWQSSAATRKPAQGPAAPPVATEPTDPPMTSKPRPVPTPTRKPKPKPSATVAASTQATTIPPPASPSASSTPKPKPTHSPSPVASSSSAVVAPTQAPPSATDTPTAAPTTGVATQPTASTDGGGLPGWLAPVLVGLLALAAGGVAWFRRVR